MVMDPYLNGFRGFDDDDDKGVAEFDSFAGNEIHLADGGVGSLDFIDSLIVSPFRGGHGGAAADSTLPFFGMSPQRDSVSGEGGDLSDPVFKYINQMLMEEDMGEKAWMLHDSLALSVAEKSLYDALGEKYPDRPSVLVDSPDGSTSQSFGFSESSSSGSSNANGASYALNDAYQSDHVPPYQPVSLTQNSVPAADVSQPSSFGTGKGFPLRGFDQGVNDFESNSSSLKGSGSGNSYSSTFNGFDLNGNGLGNAPLSSFQASEIFNDSEYIMQFQRGVEEASKFLPKTSNLIIDLDKYQPVVPEPNEVGLLASAGRSYEDEDKSFVNGFPAAEAEKNVKESSANGSRGNRSRGRKRGEIEMEDERMNKQSAVYVDEEELSVMFDNVLLHCRVKEEAPDSDVCERSPSEKNRNLNETGRDKKQGTDAVDLRTLLVLCAQAVSSDDWRTANQLLRQIRQYASPLGDGTQRLAHCFANGLEARMAGTGNQIYTSRSSRRITAADILKAYQVYLHAIPFKQIVMSFANQMIFQAASKAQTLHIVDFGILYGFQWPIFIQCLSRREGGPPKLRITGIDLPQPGFRPAERVEETGRRLEKYCKRFGVPFEYYAIAKKWDTIRIEDLSIKRNEFLAVNCLFRLKNLLDETVDDTSPRNAVLSLIREMNPDIFTHGIANGSYNAPFFVTRFREALFYYSALFDVFDATIPRDNQERLMFEGELYGKDAINVIACEGVERVERPETYKQWQVRCNRAGFRQLPLDKEVMTKLRNKMEA
uniref:Uncharacterized protein n=1 Tax=Kalanchoe fedtschenkoi TaxID=63787 RepID=A0A7N0VBK4_KALFE